MRHRYIIKKKEDSLWDWIKSGHDAWSGWLCVFLVGVIAGESRRPYLVTVMVIVGRCERHV